VAAGGAAAGALGLVEQWLPASVVSHFGVPGDVGYALIQRHRAKETERVRAIPALAVTAYARAEDRTRALSAGFQMHVAKPLEPADFVAAIASLVRKDGRAALDSAA